MELNQGHSGGKQETYTNAVEYSCRFDCVTLVFDFPLPHAEGSLETSSLIVSEKL